MQGLLSFLVLTCLYIGNLSHPRRTRDKVQPGYCQPGYSGVLNHVRMDGDRKKLNEEIGRVCKNPSEPAHNVFDELPQPIPETKIKTVARQEQDTVRELDFPQTWASVVAKNGNYRPNTRGSRLNHRRPHSFF
ncbi:hypothetical protein U1Q18_028456 [Sarracenia purpurea var. burkii]